MEKCFLENAEKYKKIVHPGDVWHGGKSIAKKITVVRFCIKYTLLFPYVLQHFKAAALLTYSIFFELNMQVGKEKGKDDLLLWAPAIRNHFWYCSRQCNGSVVEFKFS